MEEGKYTELSVYLVHKYHQQGDTPKQIARDMNRKLSEVLEILNIPIGEEMQGKIDQYFVKNRRKRPEEPSEPEFDLETMKQLREEGWTYGAIASEMGTTGSRVAYWCRKIFGKKNAAPKERQVS